MLLQFADEVGIFGRKGRHRVAVAEDAGNLAPLDRNFADVATLHLREEVGISDRLLRPARRRALKQIE